MKCHSSYYRSYPDVKIPDKLTDPPKRNSTNFTKPEKKAETSPLEKTVTDANKNTGRSDSGKTKSVKNKASTN